jgi:hypothetical protein
MHGRTGYNQGEEIRQNDGISSEIAGAQRQLFGNPDELVSFSRWYPRPVHRLEEYHARSQYDR